MAVVVAPLAGALLASVPFVVWSGIESSRVLGQEQTPFDLPLFAGQILFMAAIGSVIAIPLSATFGLAVHHLLTKTGHVSCLNYIVAGVMVGLLSGTSLLFVMLPNFFGPSFGVYIQLIIWGGGIGAVSAAIAWLIRRPDQIEPAITTP